MVIFQFYIVFMIGKKRTHSLTQLHHKLQMFHISSEKWKEILWSHRLNKNYLLLFVVKMTQNTLTNSKKIVIGDKGSFTLYASANSIYVYNIKRDSNLSLKKLLFLVMGGWQDIDCFYMVFRRWKLRKKKTHERDIIIFPENI